MKYSDIFAEKRDQPEVDEIINGGTFNSVAITGIANDLTSITLNAAKSDATEETDATAKKTFWLGTDYVVYDTLAEATAAGATETVSGS